MYPDMTVDERAKREIANLAKAIDGMDTHGWLPEDQIRYFRLHIERGIEDLQQAEDAFYELVKDGLYLGINNMQDTRLQFLEKQLADVKNYSLPTEKLIFEFVILIIVEAIIAGAMEIAAPFVLSSILAGVSAKETRKLFQLEDAAQKASQQLADWSAELDDLWVKVQQSTSETQLRSLYRDYKRVADEMAMYKAGLVKSLQAAEEAKAAMEANLPVIKVSNEDLKIFLENPMTKAALTRIGLSGGDEALNIIDKLQEGAGEEAEPAVFQTGNRAAEFISHIQTRRKEAGEGWMAWRQYVRFLSDDDLGKSVSVRAFLYRYHAVRDQIRPIPERALRGIADAFELYLWYEWASFNGIISHPTPVKGHGVSFVAPEEGMIIEGILVTDAYTILGLRNMIDGDFYPGIPKLNDEQAMYIYFKWAKAFFVKTKGQAVPAPLRSARQQPKGDFNQSRYDEVREMAERTSSNVTNGERVTRLNEMKLLVIVFLRQIFQQEVDGMDADFRGLVRKLLGVKDDDTLRLWLQSLPQSSPSQPDQSDPAKDLEPLISYLLNESDVGTAIAVGDARSQLENAVTDLDSKISLYPLQPSPQTAPGAAGGAVNARASRSSLRSAAASAPTTAVGAPTAEDALDQINQMKESLQARYADFQKLAADQEEVLSEVEAAYGDRIVALTSWEPDANEDLTWRWYGPSESEAVS